MNVVKFRRGPSDGPQPGVIEVMAAGRLMPEPPALVEWCHGPVVAHRHKLDPPSQVPEVWSVPMAHGAGGPGATKDV
ncbi:MAG: hypothetical protein R3F31_03730 [Verrucomicrobiales bacterium]